MKDNKKIFNIIGRTYDGHVLSYYSRGSRHDNPHVNRLMDEIDERAKLYGGINVYNYKRSNN